MLTQSNCRELPIAANSVDLVFTDPPYSREFLPCYDWLARQAMRVLKPGGFVLAMCGGAYLNQIYRFFDSAGLTYFWEFTYMAMNGEASYIWDRGVLAQAKAIIAYSKGPGRPRVGGIHSVYLGRKDKNFHAWGQATDHARYYIDHFSEPGALVLDPFIGGGTTAVACEVIGRRCLSMDLDRLALVTTRTRLAGADIFHTMPMFAKAQIGDVP